MPKTVYIYALREYGCDEVRYVGQSIDPNLRLRQHRWDKSLKETNAKCVWIKDVLSRGGEIDLDILGESSIKDADKIEQEWTDRFVGLGHRLTNTAKAIRPTAYNRMAREEIMEEYGQAEFGNFKILPIYEISSYLTSPKVVDYLHDDKAILAWDNNGITSVLVNPQWSGIYESDIWVRGLEIARAKHPNSSDFELMTYVLQQWVLDQQSPIAKDDKLDRLIDMVTKIYDLLRWVAEKLGYKESQ